MPRLLILYGTTDGHTAKIAAALADSMRRTGAVVDVVNAADAGPPPPDAYSKVVVCASVHVSGYQRAVRRWVKRHANALRTKPTAFVSVCLGVLEHAAATDRRLQSILEDFFRKCDWRPGVTKIVAGALPYTRYPWWKRIVLKRIASQAGGGTDTSRDYEYTDWEDLAAFGREFAGPN